MDPETRYARLILNQLDREQAQGAHYVVLTPLPMETHLQPNQLTFFRTLSETLDHLDDLGERHTPVYYQTVEALKQTLTEQQKQIVTMNLNNLENLKEQMTKLGFSEPLKAQMEEKMKSNAPNFTLRERVSAENSPVDLTLHFRQSNQSDYYYLNRFEATNAKGPQLQEGQQYFVMRDGKQVGKGMDVIGEAVELFKKQNAPSVELLVGTEPKAGLRLALQENGNMAYLAKDFAGTFRTPALPQNFWVDKGNGFSAEQAVNLMQGRAVYRDDLLSREGVPYKAWVMLDADKPRNEQGNLQTRQFMDPGYGFDLNRALKEYKIKELADPEKATAIEAAIRNGNRPAVTVEKEGKPVTLYIEPTVRYGKINFYTADNRPEKREQFLQSPEKNPMLSKDKAKEKDQAQEMSMSR